MGCCGLIKFASEAAKFLLNEGVLVSQKGYVSIVPLLPFHTLFRWVSIIIGIIWLFIAIRAIYKEITSADFNEYANLLMLIIMIAVMLWFLTLSALSVPLFIPVFILALIVPTALTFYFTYIAIHAIWITLFGD